MLGGAFEVEPDRLGRFIIPKVLRDYASIEGDAVFVGVGNRIELWALPLWQDYQKYLKDNISELGERLAAK